MKHKKEKGKQVDCVYGFHAVKPLLQYQPAQIKILYIVNTRDDKRMRELVELSNSAKVAVEYCEKQDLQKRFGITSHQGVAALLHPLQLPGEADFYSFLQNQQSPLILVLDQLQDPHNLGACLRTAHCAGVDAVVLPKYGACPINATVRKVAAGAVELLQIYQVTNLRRVLDKMRDEQVWLTATSDKADKEYYQVDYSGAVAIIMGSEGEGIRNLTAQHCDHLVSIPMAGDVSSLNVSVATGVMLFEAIRQRRTSLP